MLAWLDTLTHGSGDGGPRVSGQVFALVQDQLGGTNAVVDEAGGLPTSRLFREARAGEGRWPGMVRL